MKSYCPDTHTDYYAQPTKVISVQLSCFLAGPAAESRQFFIFLPVSFLSDRLSRNLPDQSSPKFQGFAAYGQSESSFSSSQWTLPRQPVFVGFIHRTYSLGGRWLVAQPGRPTLGFVLLTMVSVPTLGLVRHIIRLCVVNADLTWTG